MSECAEGVSLEEALAEVRPPVLVASDFDGTIAPLVENPSQAIGERRSLDALAKLAELEGVAVAVVSGRSLSDLERMAAGLGSTVIIGEHGNARLGDANDTAAGLENLAAQVRRLAEDMTGSRVEVKGHSVVFHYRTMKPSEGDDAARVVREAMAECPGVEVTTGKKIIEASLGSMNKADAVAGLADEFGVETVVFIGDDTTDEDVFEVLGPDDIGVKVGPGPTKARYRVADVEAVAAILERLVGVLGFDQSD